MRLVKDAWPDADFVFAESNARRRRIGRQRFARCVEITHFGHGFGGRRDQFIRPFQIMVLQRRFVNLPGKNAFVLGIGLRRVEVLRPLDKCRVEDVAAAFDGRVRIVPFTAATGDRQQNCPGEQMRGTADAARQRAQQAPHKIGKYGEIGGQRKAGHGRSLTRPAFSRIGRSGKNAPVPAVSGRVAKSFIISLLKNVRKGITTIRRRSGRACAVGRFFVSSGTFGVFAALAVSVATYTVREHLWDFLLTNAF